MNCQISSPHWKSRSLSATLALLAGLTGAGTLRAEPLLTSWQTSLSTKYARIYTSTANRTNGVAATTWTGQTSPTYCGVHEIDYSASWVYIKNTGMGGHIMGPWNNPNLPKNQGASGLTPVYRFPRTPAAIPSTKTLTGLGAIGFLVDGIAIYNTSDGYSYTYSASADAAPPSTSHGDGIWNRDAYPNESVSFDYDLAHNPQSGQYHSHVNPPATRYLMGDNVTYNSSSKQYAENTATTAFKHSPILGWMQDGLPIYGPYGYDGGSTGATGTANIGGGLVASVTITNGGTLYQSVPLVTFTGGGGSGAAGTAVVSGGVVTGVNMTSGGSGYTSPPTVTIGGVRRMVCGFQLRDGTNNTDNLNNGRTSLPGWAAVAQNLAGATLTQSYSLTSTPQKVGPTTTYVTGSGQNQITYTLGHYSEDYDYLGNLGYTQSSRTNSGGVFFDLNMYNARYCVTPEFPNGTWAYFITIKADGTPLYPYTAGRWYYGSPTGGTVSSITETVTQYFKGAASTAETWSATSPITESSSNVTLTWNSVEGGTYQVSASSDLTNWTALSLTVTPLINIAPTLGSIISSASATEAGGESNAKRFYKLTRTSLATYDSNGY